MKVGDKVKIREDLGNFTELGDVDITHSMHKYAGKCYTISKIFPSSTRFQLEHHEWIWSKEMFEQLPEYNYYIL